MEKPSEKRIWKFQILAENTYIYVARFHVGYEIELPLVGLNDLKKV